MNFLCSIKISSKTDCFQSFPRWRIVCKYFCVYVYLHEYKMSREVTRSSVEHKRHSIKNNGRHTSLNINMVAHIYDVWHFGRLNCSFYYPKRRQISWLIHETSRRGQVIDLAEIDGVKAKICMLFLVAECRSLHQTTYSWELVRST